MFDQILNEFSIIFLAMWKTAQTSTKHFRRVIHCSHANLNAPYNGLIGHKNNDKGATCEWNRSTGDSLIPKLIRITWWNWSELMIWCYMMNVTEAKQCFKSIIVSTSCQSFVFVLLLTFSRIKQETMSINRWARAGITTFQSHPLLNGKLILKTAVQKIYDVISWNSTSRIKFLVSDSGRNRFLLHRWFRYMELNLQSDLWCCFWEILFLSDQLVPRNRGKEPKVFWVF